LLSGSSLWLLLSGLVLLGQSLLLLHRRLSPSLRIGSLHHALLTPSYVARLRGVGHLLRTSSAHLALLVGVSSSPVLAHVPLMLLRLSSLLPHHSASSSLVSPHSLGHHALLLHHHHLVLLCLPMHHILLVHHGFLAPESSSATAPALHHHHLRVHASSHLHLVLHAWEWRVAHPAHHRFVVEVVLQQVFPLVSVHEDADLDWLARHHLSVHLLDGLHRVRRIFLGQECDSLGHLSLHSFLVLDAGRVYLDRGELTKLVKFFLKLVLLDIFV